jgi:hypothetical protein
MPGLRAEGLTMLLLLSLLAALAAQPDADTAQPAPGEWAWLNIPDAEGPGARFAYETAVRRDGPRVEIRLRYADGDPRRPRRAPVRVEARIALDCTARTAQLLERRPRDAHVRTPGAVTPVPVLMTSREAVLMRLLCAGGGRPIPAGAPGQED